MRDELVTKARSAEPPWDEVREQRVLARIQDGRKGAAKPATRGPARGVAIGAVALAAAAAVVLLVVTQSGDDAATRTADRDGAGERAETPARLDLRDGSHALLTADAHVRVDMQTEQAVVLTQTAGRVVYDVRHDPSRSFEVRARAVTVRVRGTRFAVAIDGEWIDVAVERGLVEVEAGGRAPLLEAGETIRVRGDGRATRAADVPSGDVAEAAPEATAERGASSEDAERARAATRDGERRRVREAEARHREGSARGSPSSGDGAPVPLGPDELLARADTARRAGRTDDAAAALRELVDRHSRDPRVPTALFTLARIERSRGRHAAAATAFAECRARAPSGPLAEDALAEEATAWVAAGDLARAKETARRYLSLHPSGLYADRMRAIER